MPAEVKGRREVFVQLYKQKEMQQVELIDRILSEENIKAAIHAVKSNKGAPGIDKMAVEALDEYFAKHGEEIKEQIRAKRYKPQPVRRVYIPKANGKQRPLGIPTVVDRVIQQATAQILSVGYERYFSDHSHGFRPNRSCHTAMEQALEYLNAGCEWVIDLDIEKYFDTVNHDKLISILRERINDAPTLHLIRSFLKAGVMEEGLVSPTDEGVPQGGPLSPVLSNVYLDKLDKERNGGRPRNGKREQLAGAEAAAESERDQNKSSQANRKQFLGIHVLEVVRRLEAKAAGRAQSQAVREGQGNPVQETGGSAAPGLYIHKTEPSAARVDKLFPNWQHEGMAKG